MLARLTCSAMKANPGTGEFQGLWFGTCLVEALAFDTNRALIYLLKIVL